MAGLEDGQKRNYTCQPDIARRAAAFIVIFMDAPASGQDSANSSVIPAFAGMTVFAWVAYVSRIGIFHIMKSYIVF
jgi:hypothetical protein